MSGAVSDRERARAWVERLGEATGWAEAGAAMPLGAVSLELPVVLVDEPSTRGVWTMSTLFVAPLVDVAIWLSDPSRAESVAEDVLGADAASAMVANLDAFELRKAQWMLSDALTLRLSSSQSLGPHMGLGFLARNAADYRAAPVGELVALDAMRGSQAMLCAKIVAKEARESQFEAMAMRAIGSIERELGPLAFCWQGASGRVPSPKCKGPGWLARAWPASREQWEQMHAARVEAWELAEELGVAPSAEAPGPRRV